jgi:hypothetical protein
MADKPMKGPAPRGAEPLEHPCSRMEQTMRLRDLAAWYREFAERAGNPAIWDARPRMAEDLEKEADSLMQRRADMSSTDTKGAALVTGASSGISAIYADRLAKRGQ